MDDKNYKLALFMGNEPEIMQYAVNSILTCNEQTTQYGLTLTAEQAAALVISRNESLKSSGRVEFGGGVIEKTYMPLQIPPILTLKTTKKLCIG